MTDVGHERFRAIFEHSHDAILLADDTGRIIDVNPAAEALLGYESDEMTGLHSWDFIPDLGEEKGHEVWAQFLEEGQEEGRYPLQRKDGQTVHVEYRAVAHIQPSVHLSVLRDITEQKRYEEALKQSNRDLDAFASHIAHEVLSPLSGVNLVLDQLQQRYADAVQDEDQELIHEAKGVVEGIKHLLRDLLSYARLERGEELERECVETREVLREVLTLMRNKIDEHGAEVTMGELPAVHANRTLLRHLIRNLIANGIKYNEAEVPRIHVAAEETSDAWVFRVEDNGIGISEEEQAQLFDLFRRSDAGTVKGFGIGLALSKRIVEGHGGRIWAESEPGHGSTFLFTVPREAGPSD